MPKKELDYGKSGSVADIDDNDLKITAECLLIDVLAEKMFSEEPEKQSLAAKMASHRLRLILTRSKISKHIGVSAATIKIIFGKLLPEIEILIRAHAFGKEEHKFRLLQEIIAIRERNISSIPDKEKMAETMNLIDSAIRVHEASMMMGLGKKFGEFERELNKIEEGLR